MEIFYRSKAPVYRGSCLPPKRTGLLASLWSALFGNSTPHYRTRDDESCNAAPASSGGVLAGQTPAYKTAPTDELAADPGNTESVGESPEGAVNEVFVE